MKKRKTICLLILCALLLANVSPVASAKEENTSDCYIATTACPVEYADYAAKNVAGYVLSYDERVNVNSIRVGTPFAFADIGADVYYFPVLCDGKITYLFRVYPDGNSFSAAITTFLAKDIEKLGRYTSESLPMYLNLVGTKIVATIGEDSFVLFEYPDEMSGRESNNVVASVNDFSVVNVKATTIGQLNLSQARSVSAYITLDIIEQQGNENWCTAFCLATIIRTQTNFYATAQGLMTMVLGGNPNINTPFPWISDDGLMMRVVSSNYNLYPMVLTTTVSDSVLCEELDYGRPCLVAMTASSGNHTVVLRGYSSLGTWSIWNPWFSSYESYSMTGTYVPTGCSASTDSYTPYMHAYNFQEKWLKNG